MTLAQLEAAIGYHREHWAESVEELKAFLRFRSISADPTCKAEMDRTTEWLGQYARQIGLQHPRTVGKLDLPKVFFCEGAGDGPRIIIYGHYDVQPTGDESQWPSPPFEPTIVGDRLGARGAIDDKGQLMMHFWAAKAWMRTLGRLPCATHFCVEGEEESGGAQFQAVVDDPEHADFLQGKVLMVSDTDQIDENTPAVTGGLRGIVASTVTVHGANRNLHSGEFGGIFLNPLVVISHLVARTIGLDGRVLLPDFNEGLVRLSPGDLRLLCESRPGDGTLAERIGASLFPDADGVKLAERCTVMSTFEPNGIGGTHCGNVFSTIIPGTVSLQSSFRVGPGMDAARLELKWREHVARIIPEGMRYEIDIKLTSDALSVDTDHPLVQRVRAAAETVFGRPCGVVRSGGSIPIIGKLAKKSGAVPILYAVGLEEDGMHQIGESIGLERLDKGTETIIRSQAAFADMT